MRPISFHDEIKELLNMNYFAHSLCLKPFSVILFRSYCKSSHNIQTLSKLLDRESRRWASNISAVVLFVLFSFINNNNYGTCSSNRVNYKRQKGQSIGHSSLVKRRLQRKIGLVTIYENIELALLFDDSQTGKGMFNARLSETFEISPARNLKLRQFFCIPWSVKHSCVKQKLFAVAFVAAVNELNIFPQRVRKVNWQSQKSDYFKHGLELWLSRRLIAGWTRFFSFKM